MNKFTDSIFYLFGYIRKGSSYEDRRDYNLMQRTHNAYAQTDKGLYSPCFYSLITMMWKLGKRIVDIFSGRELVEKKFLKSLPDWKSLDKVTHVDWSRMGWIAICAGELLTGLPTNTGQSFQNEKYSRRSF